VKKRVRGPHHVTLDEKGRLALPAKLKEVLAPEEDTTLVLAWFRGAIKLYTLAQWEEIEDQAADLSQFDLAHQDFLYSFMANASEVKVDKLGRMLVPQYLRERAGLVRDVVILTYLGRVEIWDRIRWQERERDATKGTDDAGGPANFLAARR